MKTASCYITLCPLKFIPIGNFTLKKNIMSQEMNTGDLSHSEATV